MAKLEDVTPDLKKRIDDVLHQYDLARNVSALVLSKDMKEIGKVAKASEVVKYTTKDDVVVLINEEVFDLIAENEDDDTKYAVKQIIIENILTGIEFNEKTSNVSIVKPEFITYTGILKDFGADEMVRLYETVKAAKEQIKEEGTMGDLVDLFDDIKKLFENEIVTMGLDNLNIHILSNDKEGERGKLKKVDELAKVKHNDKDDIELVINQRIFELLSASQQIIAARVVLSNIAFNDDNHSFEFKKPDFVMHGGVVTKYGAENCISADKAVKDAFRRKKELDEEKKEAEKQAKNRAAAHA